MFRGIGIVFIVLLLTAPVRGYAHTHSCWLIGYSVFEKVSENIAENVRRALSDAGICVEMQAYPSKRGTVNFQSGLLDGYILRTPLWGNDDSVPGVMVDELLYSTSGYLISHQPLSEHTDYMKTHRIGVVRGSAWSDRLVAGNNNILEITDTSLLINMFIHRRIGAILSPSPPYENSVHKFSNPHVYPVSDILLYFWLHKRHSHRVGDVRNALVRYKDTRQAFDQDAINPVAGNPAAGDVRDENTLSQLQVIDWRFRPGR